MPATSQAQQKAAGAALSAKRGDTRVKDLKGASKDMYKSMTEKELDDMASTRLEGLPKKKSDCPPVHPPKIGQKRRRAGP